MIQRATHASHPTKPPFKVQWNRNFTWMLKYRPKEWKVAYIIRKLSAIMLLLSVAYSCTPVLRDSISYTVKIYNMNKLSALYTLQDSEMSQLKFFKNKNVLVHLKIKRQGEPNSAGRKDGLWETFILWFTWC